MAKRKTGESATRSLTLIMTKSTNEFGWHFLPVEAEVVEQFAFEGKSKRVVCTLNGEYSFQCALMPSGGTFYIIVNKKIRDSLGIVAGDPVRVDLVRDESQYGLPIPDELREVLDQDPDGDRMFHALTAGKQRGMLYYIGKIKDVDKRIHACLIFIDHLRRNDGKLINRELNEELKRPMF